jgi:uncharacterized protein (DUF58 family)
MITGVPLRLTLSAFGFMLAGMVTGNIYMIQLGLVPLLFVILGFILRQPTILSVEPPSPSLSVDLGDDLIITRKVTVEDGVGLITVGEELPSSFELLKGNNIQAFWKKPGRVEFDLKYQVRCTRRGTYKFTHLFWEARHPLGMVPTRLGSVELNQELIVKPRTLRVKRIRQQKVFTKIPMPAESRIQMGVPNTDFKELRDYSFGDSYKQINWKATARKQRSSLPTVNEYEKEGRQVVYVFLDTSKHMGIGTTLSNSFEFAVQATLGLTEFYLARQCMVGVSLFSSESSSLGYGEIGDVSQGLVKDGGRSLYQTVFPEGGKVQQHRIQRMLLEAELQSSRRRLREALVYVRGHVLGTNPLFVVVTRVREENMAQLSEGAKELSKYIKNRRQRPNILVVNVSGYDLASNGDGESLAVQLMEFKESNMVARLRALGITAVNWHPYEQSITEVLLSQVRGG